MRRVLFGVAMLAAGGCTMGPDYVRPPVPEPAEYREAFPSEESIANIPWWELFQDTVLHDLIDSTLANNRDLGVAMGRISEARAIAGIVRADLFPRVNYGAIGSIEKTTVEGSDATSDATVFAEASYIVDLWGRVRRSNEAAQQEVLASEEAYRGVTIALVAAVANSYLLLRDLDNRLSIAQKTLESWRANLDVVEARFRAGMVSEVDVSQAKIQVYDAEVSVQTFERLRVQTENALSVLMGMPPASIPRGQSLTDVVVPPELPSGLPADLLQRRPDVLEAERRLHAQTARIGVAVALKFPQLDLTADLGGAFNGGNTGFLGFGAQIFGPLYNSGEFQRRVEVEEARTVQLLNVYEQTILTSLREVNDALVAIRTYEAQLESRRNQVDAARTAADLSWVRYEGGLTSYLEVLDLQRSLFTSQLLASETLQLRLTSIVQLYQALGGGWVAEQDTVIVPASN